MIRLCTLIKNAKSWDDIHNELVKYNLKDDRSAGKLFEEFCKFYYQCEPAVSSEYKNVWLFSEIPSPIKEKLNLGKKDHGIDLVLEDHDGAFSVVQCKFKNNQNKLISWTKDRIANFFADGDQADYFIVFTNASGLDEHSLSKKINKLEVITLGDLLNLSKSTIAKIAKHSLGEQTLPIEPKKPREYQQVAINKVIYGFERHDRGQLILPCGAGKTLVSLWIKETLSIKHTLVLVPSLALLRQIKNEWAINHKRFIPYICVCSEKDIDKRQDSSLMHIYEISSKVSTDPDEIQNFLIKHSETIIYSTYQSLEAICDAIKPLNFKFDLAICDEAHKTSGSKLSNFGLIHLDSNIPVKKRLYMTATPRIMSNCLKNESNKEVLEYLYDMSNINIFGPEFYRMSFKEAIEKNILVDYKIVGIGIGDKELEKAIKNRNYTSDNETIDEIANNYALAKFMNKHGPTHAITFHSTVKKAEAFKARHQAIDPEVKTYHVNGKLTTNERNILMNAFENSPRSIMTNARCLTEGIDVPTIDVVYFCDPKNSKIDIVQASGRALRRADHKQKKLGYIVVPIFHREKENLEEMIDTSPFKNLISVIRELCSHDERLADEIKEIKLGKGDRISKTKHISISYICELITLEGFHETLRKKLFDQMINKIRIPWRDFEDARKFARSLNLKSHLQWIAYYNKGEKPEDIPTSPEKIYKDKGWISWPDWLGTNNKAPKDYKFLSFEDARKFVHQLNIKNESIWRIYSKSGSKPDYIPSNPNVIYESKGWISWPDWLGTKNKGRNDWNYLTFVDARNFVHKLKLKSETHWREYLKFGDKPENIPGNPATVYKDKGWISWGDWLGTGRRRNQGRVYRPFPEARKYVRSLNLRNSNQWKKFCKSGKKPEDIPAKPYVIYKDKGWISLADWLGTNNKRGSDWVFLPFQEARKFVHGLKLKSKEEWGIYCKSGKKPENIPFAPHLTYKNHGWVSWPDWTGRKISNIEN